MKSRAGVLVVVGIVLLGVAMAVLGHVLRARRAPGAIVLVTLDTLRADRLGAYGSTAGLTPELDRLAASGVTFERAWTTAPLTIPAHASMLTGLLPPLHGLRTNARGRRLPPPGARPFSTVAEVLRDGGFRTGAFVSASVLRADRTGLDAGFDTYDEVPAAPPGALHDAERPATETVDAALAWVRAGDGPLFLWVHLFDPHAPYLAPPPWGAGAEHAADAVGYDGEVRYVDHAVGLLREGLTAAGYGDAALVVVADHGEALGAHGERTHGYLLHEETLHVPLIVSAPGLVGEGERRTDDVSVIDIAPTLVSLADLSIPATMDGRTLFAGRKGPPARAPYAESLYGWESSRWAQVFALREGAEKIVDAGPRALVYDLRTDAAERAPVTPAETSGHLRDRLAALHRVAGLRPLAAPTSTPDELSGGSYWSASAADDGVLSPEENAALPSPYDRMDELAALDRGRGLLAAGDAPAAREAFEGVVAADPGNPQARRWLGRALLACGEPAAAAAAYRAAFERGWTSPDCVSKALQCAAAAVQAGARDEIAPALAFLTTARGQGVAQDGPGFVFEAFLLLEDGREDEARAALENARKEPPTAALRQAITDLEKRLP